MYVKHPVCNGVVEKIQAQGYKIVDIRFKPDELPDGDKVYEDKPKRKTRKAAD